MSYLDRIVSIQKGSCHNFHLYNFHNINQQGIHSYKYFKIIQVPDCIGTDQYHYLKQSLHDNLSKYSNLNSFHNNLDIKDIFDFTKNILKYMIYNLQKKFDMNCKELNIISIYLMNLYTSRQDNFPSMSKNLKHMDFSRHCIMCSMAHCIIYIYSYIVHIIQLKNQHKNLKLIYN